MTSTVKFVVNFEYPSCDVKILSDKLSQRVYELLFIININAAYRSWNISQLENLLGSRFSGIKVLF
jgi:hypothetical protein